LFAALTSVRFVLNQQKARESVDGHPSASTYQTPLKLRGGLSEGQRNLQIAANVPESFSSGSLAPGVIGLLERLGDRLAEIDATVSSSSIR
jgi:hypothetical protein